MNALKTMVIASVFLSVGYLAGALQSDDKLKNEIVTIDVTKARLRSFCKALTQLSDTYKDASTINLTILRNDESSFLIGAIPRYVKRGTFLGEDIFLKIQKDGSLVVSGGH